MQNAGALLSISRLATRDPIPTTIKIVQESKINFIAIRNLNDCTPTDLAQRGKQQKTHNDIS